MKKHDLTPAEVAAIRRRTTGGLSLHLTVWNMLLVEAVAQNDAELGALYSAITRYAILHEPPPPLVGHLCACFETIKKEIDKKTIRRGK